MTLPPAPPRCGRLRFYVWDRVVPEYWKDCTGCTRDSGHEGPHRCFHGTWTDEEREQAG